MKDSFKQLQEERKRDIDETADFIKQVITQGKQETQGEIQKVSIDIDRLRRDMQEKASCNEVAETIARLATLIESKVDLREVQTALNECQSDIKEQLIEFRHAVTNDQRQAEADLRKMVERKAGI